LASTVKGVVAGSRTGKATNIAAKIPPTVATTNATTKTAPTATDPTTPKTAQFYNPTTGKIIYFASINTNTGNTRFALGGGFTSNRHSIISRRLDADVSSVLSGSTATNTTNQILITAQCDWGNGDGFIYLNTSYEATNTSFTTNGNTSNTNSTNSCIGGIKTDPLNVNNINAHIFEIIIYNNITNKSGIETNINSYYGIY